MNIVLPGPFGLSDLTISSSNDGTIKAKAVEHKEPIREIKRPNFGTASATATEIIVD